MNSRYANRGYDTVDSLSSFIKTEIDNGRPMILQLPEHVVVIVGYDFSDPANPQVICHDSAANKGYDYVDDISSVLYKIGERNTSMRSSIIYFRRTV